MPAPIPVSQRLAENTVMLDGCLVWTGAVNDAGYGVMSVRGKIVRAHRAAWAQTNGPIPPGVVIRHSCDNPPCCLLDHLLAGSKKQNTEDMISRGRQRFHPENLIPGYRGPIGEDHHRSRLTEDNVREIRSVGAGESQRALAQRFGVSQAVVWAVLNRVTWKEVV